MDVIALLKKYRQLPKSFDVEVDISSSEGKQPVVFVSAILSYLVTGEVDPQRLLESVQLSQTKFCSVSAMLSQSFPIHFRIELNGVEIGTGKTEFPSQLEIKPGGLT